MNERERMIQSMMDAVDANDYDRLREIFADDVYYERPRAAPFVGIDSLLRFFREERSVSGKHVPEQIIADDNRGAAWGVFRGKNRSGADVEITWADVYEFDAVGRIRWRRSYMFDRAPT
jgi:ketosteroid isomerase-like protein